MGDGVDWVFSAVNSCVLIMYLCPAKRLERLLFCSDRPIQVGDHLRHLGVMLVVRFFFWEPMETMFLYDSFFPLTTSGK